MQKSTQKNLKLKPTKEELEERAQAKAHKQRLRQLREEDTCPEYDDGDVSLDFWEVDDEMSD